MHINGHDDFDDDGGSTPNKLAQSSTPIKSLSKYNSMTT